MQGVTDYFAHLPGVDNPEIFGMHENANVTFNTNESLGLMYTVSALFRNTETEMYDKSRSEKTSKRRSRCWLPRNGILVYPSAELPFSCTLFAKFF